MNKLKSALLGLFVVAAPALADVPAQLGKDPIPVMIGTTVTSDATYDAANTVYNYSYTITVPSTATGSIGEVRMDMTAPWAYFSGSVGFPLTIPYGVQGPMDSNAVLFLVDNQLHFPHNEEIIYFGEVLPAGWSGDIDANGNGIFNVSNASAKVAPGHTASGFIIQSPGQPTIKDVMLVPDWILDDSDGTLTEAQYEQAGTVADQLVIHVPGLGPSAFQPLSDDQWTQFQGDVSKAMTLGWITDATFGNGVLSQLAAARTVFDAQGPGFVVDKLNALQAFIAASTPTQRNSQAYELLSMNVTGMIGQLPPPGGDPDPQYSPDLSLSFQTATTLPVGATVTFTGHVFDKANNNAPIPNAEVRFTVEGVTDVDQNTLEGVTDTNGNFVVSYVGTTVGVDEVSLKPNSEETADKVAVTWTGGPDLTIKSFVPPVLEWQGTGPIHVTEMTQNLGNVQAGASTTDYYVSTSTPFDWTNAVLIGSRDVPALAAGATSSNGGIDLAMPDGYGPGTYTLIACADDLKVVTETDETNNCETSQVAAAMKNSNPVNPPVCSSATPSATILWPPNHKMASITIGGVTDPTGLSVSIVVAGIHQDEPVNGTGDGDTAPDGAGIGTSTAQVRVERSGIAVDGRLYFISFTATDTSGQSCTGTVTVGVPHDKGQHNMPVDNGQRYDSTATH